MASKRLRDQLELARWDLLNEISVNLSLAREMLTGTYILPREATPEHAQSHLRHARETKRRYDAIDHAWGMARKGKTDRQIWRFLATTSEAGYLEQSHITHYASSARERMKNAYAFEQDRADRLFATRGIRQQPRTPRYVLRCLRAERIVNRATAKVDLANLAYDRAERQHAFAEEETYGLLNR